MAHTSRKAMTAVQRLASDSLRTISGRTFGEIRETEMVGARARRKRQQMAGAAFGRAMNTQPQGPATSTVTQAATTDPSNRTYLGRSGKFTTVQLGQPGQPSTTPIGGQSQPASQTPTTSSTTPEAAGPMAAPAPDNSGLAAQLGRESVTRSRKKNRSQQAALSGAALS